MKLITRAALPRMAIAAAILAVLLLAAWAVMVRMPGASWRGPLPPLDEKTAAVRDALARDVRTLAVEIGERNMQHMEAYGRARAFVEQSLGDAGYSVKRETFAMGRDELANLVAEKKGGAKAAEIVVVGAHYDSVMGTPGANDNGSGVAALLALARAFADRSPARTIRFVAFANEEPPYFQTDDMGSAVYARGCRARNENVVAMLSLETMGYFSDAPRSQKYPPPFSMLYPSTGNFIGVVGNVSSASLVRRVVGSFRAAEKFPIEGAAIPAFIDGVAWSDQWGFWRDHYPAVMLTDTAPFRYPHYHEETDTPEKIDYDRLARVVRGLEAVVADLAGR